MECDETRSHLLDRERGRLTPKLAGEVRAHLDRCPACARDAEADAVLTDLLERRLPQHPASLALKRRLAERWPSPPPPRRWWKRCGPALGPAAAVAIAVLLVLPLYQQRVTSPSAGAMVQESVNDYLRLISSQRPLEVEAGGIHQVKPWFEGRLNFAPVIEFEGDQDFPLKGGAVGYFLDRKAAVFVYGRRLHTISLFVFQAEGLPWPSRGLTPLGKTRAHVTRDRGFNVILWRAGDLGYALVSDLDARELADLGSRLAGGA